MGIPSCKSVDARRRVEPRGVDDLRQTQAGLCQGGCRWAVASLIAYFGSAVDAEKFGIATYAAPLSRDGPGLLLRNILRGEDPQITAVQGIIGAVDPDVIVLTDFDYDLDGMALAAFVELTGYPFQFAALPNAGMPTGLDIDGNKRLGEARDAQGYGRFSGDGGMAILSKMRIQTDAVVDLSATLWRDVDGAILPSVDGAPFPSEAAQAVQRISSASHWILPIVPQDTPPFSLLAWSATPPVFDGPEDRNGLRKRDELRMWANLLDTDPPSSFVIAGNANLDPVDGGGLRDAMATFLARDDVIDP